MKPVGRIDLVSVAVHFLSSVIVALETSFPCSCVAGDLPPRATPVTGALCEATIKATSQMFVDSPLITRRQAERSD